MPREVIGIPLEMFLNKVGIHTTSVFRHVLYSYSVLSSINLLFNIYIAIVIVLFSYIITHSLVVGFHLAFFKEKPKVGPLLMSTDVQFLQIFMISL